MTLHSVLLLLILESSVSFFTAPFMDFYCISVLYELIG